VKYTPPGGRVAVICEDRPSDLVRIAVHDTGPGIAPDALKRLFAPFERLGAEHTPVEGTGLGLALSRRLVEAMGGQIGVESTVGRGSIFWVDLPGAESPESLLERDAAGFAGDAVPAVTRTVLYLEDNPSNIRLLEHVFSLRPRLRLITAMQGRLGLDLARDHHPDLIILDLHLPDLSGEEALASLRADPRTRDIPVIVISADAAAERVDRLSAVGARAYLTKPLDLKKFLDVVGEILDV
jgi:CheY-like chemotaxis protein